MTGIYLMFQYFASAVVNATALVRLVGQIMDIKLPTVKTHVSHILTKLDVSRRSEAKTAAKRLWLIPDDKN